MDRAAWARTGIVTAILVLLAMILITPTLIGRPPELGSLPLLIVGLTQDRSTFVVHVGGAVGSYMYANVTLAVRGIGNASSYEAQAMENDTYDANLRVPVNVTASFAIHTYLVDRQENYFEYNVTVDLGRDAQDRLVLIFTLADEKEPRVERRTPPEDFRWPVPLRGAL
ncbi:MAG: hypothetical protein ACT4OI_09430 [Methanobacteriota archaeon]